MKCGCLAQVLERIERLERLIEIPPVRACAYCGKALQGKRGVALYCSASCKQRAHVKRKEGQGPRRTCALEGCEGTFALTDPRRIYCGDQCRSRASWRARKRRAMRAVLEALR
jgi:hypothetical protein